MDCGIPAMLLVLYFLVMIWRFHQIQSLPDDDPSKARQIEDFWDD